MSEIKIPISELHFFYSKSSGPGGQKVNKTNTKVSLIWDVNKSTSLSKAVKERFIHKFTSRIQLDGTLQITSQRFRSQARNTTDCTEKLHKMVNSVLRPPKKRRPTRPTKSSVEKRLQQKKAHSDKKKSRQKV